MDIEAFPEIEDFQHLPKRVIVKGGTPALNAAKTGTLSGIVINNSGHGIRDLKISVVLFDQNKIPIVNMSTKAEPDSLNQGGIGSFSFNVSGSQTQLTDYHLYSDWSFDD